MYAITTIGSLASLGCTADGQGCLSVEPAEPPPSTTNALTRPVKLPVVGNVVPRDALLGAAVGVIVGAMIAKALRG